MEQPALNFTIGLARSGKSTICQQWLHGKIAIVNGIPCETPYSITQSHPRIVICDDAIRRAITGDRFNLAAESQVYALKYGMIRTMLKQGYEVMVDDTHTTDVSVQRLLEINHKANFMLVDTDVDECIQRAIKTKQEDLVEVIKRHHANMKQFIGVDQYDGDLPTDIQLSMAIGYRIAGLRDDVISQMDYTDYTKRV